LLDWLIIGGGIQGTHLAFYLTHRMRVPLNKIRLLDPHSRPLMNWERLTGNVGMRYLRSPHVHNLHYDPYSLVTFAQTQAGAALADFIPLYNRPSLPLFQAHSWQLIEQHRLLELWMQGRAQRIQPLGNSWQIETEHGTLSARRVILAFGLTEQPHYPDWARFAPNALVSGRLAHIFATDFDRQRLSAHVSGVAHLVVVGGGITAAQTALSLIEQGHAVTLLVRHPLREFAFDSDTCWVVPQCLDRFHALTNHDQRRQMLAQVRHRGSVPADVKAQLDLATSIGKLQLRFDAVQAVQDGDPMTLHLHSGAHCVADAVVLATGFNTTRPGGAWLDEAVADYGWPIATCGYPIVDQQLSWAKNLYVAGALAELEVGPTARNIIGARLAAYRIGTVL
jgi:thioredoxin reductase